MLMAWGLELVVEVAELDLPIAEYAVDRHCVARSAGPVLGSADRFHRER